MSSFDYITTADFRESLERDLVDMGKCAEIGAWKSAQVLAGSIVEALLIDYLVSTPKPDRGGKDPLRMDLSDAIAICRNEGVLSDRSADLCSAVRSYRNLIHPGRMVRLNEPAPSKASCDIAKALIDLITEEISKTRRRTVGLTAEQILSKLMRDPGCLTILKHLLVEVSGAQLQRLLVTVIPAAYFENIAKADPWDVAEISDRLSEAFRIALDGADGETKKTVAQEFVRILKEEDGPHVEQYRAAFFRAGDLASVTEQSRPLVKEHILGAVGTVHTPSSIRMLEMWIGPFLEPMDCVKWVDPFVRTLVSKKTTASSAKAQCKELFVDTMTITSKEFDEVVRKRLRTWVNHYKGQGMEENSQIAKSLLDEAEGLLAP